LLVFCFKEIVPTKNFSRHPAQVADFFCWAIQRVLEKKESRFYNYIKPKIKNINLLWDAETWKEKVLNCKEYK
jgi:hypothetical protein